MAGAGAIEVNSCWVKQTVTTAHGSMDTYRRPALLLRRIAGSSLATESSGGLALDYVFGTLETKSTTDLIFYDKTYGHLGLQDKQEITVVVEIARSRDGSPRPHALQWARLPELPEYEDESLADSMGMRVEYKDVEGKLHMQYIQTGLRDQYQPHRPVRSYVVSTAIIHYLQQEKIRNPPEWVLEFGDVTIKEVKVSIFDQKITFDEQSLQTFIQPPGVFSMQACQRLLEDRGAKNFGHPERLMTSKAEDSFLEKWCDFCVELSRFWDGQINELFASDNICKQSERYRASCSICDCIRLDYSWTESWSAAQRLAYRNAIVPTPLKVNESGYHIERDPELCELPPSIPQRD
jgi:hypothetical protein